MRHHFKISVFSLLVMFVTAQMSMSVMASTFQSSATEQYMLHASTLSVSEANHEMSNHMAKMNFGSCHKGENHCADNASDNCASGACVIILGAAEYNFPHYGPEQRSILPTSLRGVVIPLEIRPPKNLV